MPDPGASVPDYPVQSGPVLVAGSAWTLHDDLARAWEIYPGAPVIAVNDASRLVKAVGIVTQHPERIDRYGWARNQARLFGPCPTHANAPPADYVWNLPSRGGSAWLARRIASSMGYGPVILCGCPLERGGYAVQHLHGLMHREDVVDDLFAQIERDTEWHEGALSMSGRTAELLCSP